VLGHVGIFRNLIAAAGLEGDAEAELFDCFQRKAYGDLDALLEQNLAGNTALADMLRALSRLSGDVSALEEAERVFAAAPENVRKAVAEVRAVADRVAVRLPQISLGFDLSELRGYQYHTGMVFAAYTPGYGRAVAKGGRFDDIGEVFGRARPASGFDADLKILARLSNRDYPRRRVILAPDSDDAGLQQLIDSLRSEGQTVVTHLGSSEPDAALIRELECSRRIVPGADGGW